jgi:hypothetical protein
MLQVLTRPCIGLPFCKGVSEDNAPAFQAQDDEDVENLKADRGDDEHVDGDDLPSMVLEEGCPILRLGLGRLRPDASQVARNRALADNVTELQ